MPTAEERMRILKMISDKQITAAEGARLLEALKAGEPAAARDDASSRPLAAGEGDRPA